MKKFTFIFSLTLFFTFLFLNNCVSTKQNSPTSDVWNGNITGQAIGIIKIFLNDDNGSAGTKTLSGEIVGKISSANQYGGGSIDGKLSGIVTNNMVKGKITGNASVSDADSPITGHFSGELSETSGSGEWFVQASLDLARLKGRWSIKKQSLSK